MPSIDPREPRKITPAFDWGDEEQTITNEMMDMNRELPPAKAKALAKKAVQDNLRMDLANGDPLWTSLDGRTEGRGAGARAALAHQIAVREKEASFGLDPKATARELLRARGCADDEIDRVMRNRLRRDLSGEIAFDDRLGERWIPVAVDQFYHEILRRRQQQPNPAQDAVHRAAAERRGTGYSV